MSRTAFRRGAEDRGLAPGRIAYELQKVEYAFVGRPCCGGRADTGGRYSGPVAMTRWRVSVSTTMPQNHNLGTKSHEGDGVW